MYIHTNQFQVKTCTLKLLEVNTWYSSYNFGIVLVDADLHFPKSCSCVLPVRIGTREILCSFTEGSSSQAGNCFLLPEIFLLFLWLPGQLCVFPSMTKAQASVGYPADTQSQILQAIKKTRVFVHFHGFVGFQPMLIRFWLARDLPFLTACPADISPLIRCRDSLPIVCLDHMC